MKHAEAHIKAADANKSDDKTVILHDKWNAKDVLAHWKDTVEQFKKHSGFEPPAMEMEGGDEMMMEGMEGMDMAAMNMDAVDPGAGMESMEKTVPNPFVYDKDARDYAGFKNFPALLLRNMIVNASIFDEAKATAIGWEFNPQSGPKKGELASAAALISAAASKAVKGEQTVWFSAFVGAQDKLSLDAVHTGSKKIHFPWISVGWATKEEAVNAFAHSPAPGGKGLMGDMMGGVGKAGALLTFGMVGGDDELHQVVFEVEKAAAFQFLDCRWVVHRLNGTIEAAATKEDKISIYKMTAAALAPQTVKQWEESKTAAAAAATPPAAAATPPAAAAAAPKTDEMMGEMMMEEKMMEGETA